MSDVDYTQTYNDTHYIFYITYIHSTHLIEFRGTEVIPSDTIPPAISILSPENKTYTANDVPLSFLVNESASWIIYSLDGQANVTIAGNTTLTGLSDGSHSVIVYANDTAGNIGSSEMIYFSISTQREPFPIWIVAVIVIVAAFGTAVYLLKIRKSKPTITKQQSFYSSNIMHGKLSRLLFELGS